MGQPSFKMFALVCRAFRRFSILKFLLPKTTAEDFLLGGAGKKKAAAGKPVPGKPGKAAAGASTVSEWNPANMGMNVPDCGPLGGNCPSGRPRRTTPRIRSNITKL